MKKADKSPKDLEKALDRLFSLHRFGIKLGLELERSILNFLGNPERDFVSVHVAGTNGKGSVCAMIDSVLRAAGYRIGLYTSPHLVRFNERIRFNGACVSDLELVELLEAAQQAVRKAETALGDREATFFEVTTAMAFEYFKRKRAQVAVVETGMGGRLDATNVVMPLVSVITPISIEHTAHLGKNLESIAGEKAGIIKDKRPVICGALEDTALQVVERTCRERHARLIKASDAVSVRRLSQDLSGQKIAVESAQANYGTLMLPLLGGHQLQNVAIAVAALEEIAALTAVDLPVEVVKKGLSETKWPGRCQVLSKEPTTILDSAHNPGAAAVLVATLKELLKGKRLGLVTGICSDKDAAGFLKAFAGCVVRCWLVPIRSERCRPVGEYARAAKRLGMETVETTLPTAMEEARQWALSNNGAICIAGSLFLTGEVLEMLRIET